MSIRVLLLALFTGSFVSAAAAQGSDDCATPQHIAGQGNFAFDSSAATTGAHGQLEAFCNFFGNSAVDNDVWFEWTADASGSASVALCGNALFDTKLAAYPANGCPTFDSAIACNDDACLLQSKIDFACIGGTSYMLQVGSFPGDAGGTGSMDIVINVVAPGTAYCSCDGSGAASTCGTNNGVSGRGCANGFDASGAQLSASGDATVGADTLVLSATGIPFNQAGLFFQGDSAIALPFGDGIRCAGGAIIRLGVASEVGNGIDTTAFGVALSVKGGVSIGDLRRYQVWYRDPIGSTCGAGFNTTNGYGIQW